MDSGPARERDDLTLLTVVITLALCYGSYFVLRYLGYWMDQDTAQFVNFIFSLREHGRIDHAGAYSHGFAYSTWAAILQAMTGLSVSHLTQLFLPLVGNVLIAVIGFATFRYFLASSALGALTVAIYFLIPELVFTVSRGNHEKLTIALVLIASLALAKSLPASSPRRDWVEFAAWNAVLYTSLFVTVSLNAFFGFSFVAAVTLTFVFLTLGARLIPRFGTLNRHLRVKVAVAWLLIGLVILYVYPSTGGLINVIGKGFERITILLELSEPDSDARLRTLIATPYAVANTFWRSIAVYRILTFFRWLLLLISLAIWVAEVVSVIRRRSTILPRHILLLGFYGAFAVQMMVSIPIDFLGTQGGSNLQVRLYTYFALFSAPFLALGLFRLSRSRIAGFATTSAFVATILMLSVLSALKATLDPGVSNHWLFYKPEEVIAIDFWEHRHLATNRIWVSPGGRLRYGYVAYNPEIDIENSRMDVGNPVRRLSRFALYSPLIVEECDALSVGGSPLWLESLAYDNGFSRIYFDPL